MPLYYNGNIEEDIFPVLGARHAPMMLFVCSNVGYGAVQQMAVTGGVGAQQGIAFIPQINYMVGELGIHEFCRMVQVLWAAKSKANGLPLVGAFDLTYDDQYQHLLPPRPTSN